MDRLSRTDSKYLQLFTEEHNVLKSEMQLIDEYKVKEGEERDLFLQLSTSLRDSQEKERTRAEQLKYLQLGLSITCTTLGILSAFLYNYFRNSQIKQVLANEDKEFGRLNELLAQMLSKQDESTSSLSKQLEQLKSELKQPSGAKQPIATATKIAANEADEKPTDQQPKEIKTIQPKTYEIREMALLAASFILAIIFFTQKAST